MYAAMSVVASCIGLPPALKPALRSKLGPWRTDVQPESANIIHVSGWQAWGWRGEAGVVGLMEHTACRGEAAPALESGLGRERDTHHTARHSQDGIASMTGRRVPA
jgi:hypothetical protein